MQTAANYKNYMLAVLTLILTFNYVDRVALGLLLHDIKTELLLTDTQLGFLSGIAFFFFYSVFGIPIARWADRGNRVTIITISTGLWSIALILCGFAGGFIHLLLIRIGVAVGEAGCVPPAHSLIADYFNQAERPKAVAIYKLGIPLSLLIGYLLAGWLSELYGWRIVFMLLGLPGLVLAGVAGVTLREPRRERLSTLTVPSSSTLSEPASVPSPSAQPSLKEVCMALWANTTFRHLVLAYSIISFFLSGIGKWTPSFFIRSYGLGSGEVGIWFALIYGGIGLTSTLLGGVLASRYAANNERLQLNVIGIMYCIFAVTSACKFLSPNAHVAFAWMAVSLIGIGMVGGPLFATIQSIVADRMRAMSIAILFLFANLIGHGLAPLLVGILSDAFRPWAGEESLRYALLALCPGYVWCALHLWLAGKTVTRDIENVRTIQEEIIEGKGDLENAQGFHGTACRPAAPRIYP